MLIIDDALTTRTLLKKYLNEIGFQNIVTADNGENALAMLNNSFNVGLIFCDWNMPHMNGIELLKKVRKLESFRDTPFIMVTSERSPEKVKMAVEHGVSNYIVKPFSQEIILEKLQGTYEVMMKNKNAA